MEFINLSRIFKDKSALSSVPSVISPIFCYKHNKPILPGNVLRFRISKRHIHRER